MKPLRAVIFDLDGTLTTLEVDFAQLRRRLGIDDRPVFEAILAMDAPQRRHAETILLDVELKGARRCTLIPHAKHVLNELAKRHIPAAVLTRNCRRAADIALERHDLNVQAIRSREDQPLKPDPAGVIDLARELNVDPAETLVVGDYIFDIQAGQRAGACTALFVHDRPLPDYAPTADHVITDLRELLTIINP